MTRLVVVGAGGHGRVVADAASEAADFDSIVFLDDRFPELSNVDGWSVVGTVVQLDDVVSKLDRVVIAIGDTRKRLELLLHVDQRGHRLTSVIHPRSIVSRRAQLGIGAMVLAGACINTGARLGRGVIVNTGATVDHDCILDDGVHVCPGVSLAGNVQVGQRSWIGIGAVVKQGIVIGHDVLIGAGAVVVNDIESCTRAIGVPARVVATNGY